MDGGNMPEDKEAPRPHGDKLKDAADNSRNNPEDNQAQVQSDAQPDAVGGIGGGRREESDRDEGRGSTANGVPAFDEDDGAQRKRQYKDGAELVSGID
jgi:hypothetical protein